MGPIKGEGPHGEVSWSLFIVELERWALILHFLISIDLNDGLRLQKQCVMARWKVAPAFFRPKGMT